MGIVRALWELGDFIWKACQTYVQTPEGAAELEDILQAWNGDSDPSADNPQSSEGK